MPIFDIDRIVIWGYKIRSLTSYIHTHAWIHQGFYMGFKRLGYETHWFDDQDNPKINFKKTLFITMGDKENTKMPCRPDSFYITPISLHFSIKVSHMITLWLCKYIHMIVNQENFTEYFLMILSNYIISKKKYYTSLGLQTYSLMKSKKICQKYITLKPKMLSILLV